MVCDECGLTYYDDQMMKRWDGAYVDEKCWEPRHPQEFVYAKSDPAALTKVRPDTLVLTVDNSASPTVGVTGVSAKPGPATHLFQ